MVLDLGSSFSTFKRDEHQSCDLKWRSSNGKVGNFTQPSRDNAKYYWLVVLFASDLKPMCKSNCKISLGTGKEKHLKPPPISSQETSIPKKMMWFDTCEKRTTSLFEMNSKHRISCSYLESTIPEKSVFNKIPST